MSKNKYNFRKEVEFHLFICPEGSLISEVIERRPGYLHILPMGRVSSNLPSESDPSGYIFKIYRIKHLEEGKVLLEGMAQKYEIHSNKLGKKRKAKVILEEFLEERKERKILCF